MSRLGDKAMINADGHVFQPATVEIAQDLAIRYGARPADHDRFPWRCAQTQSFYEWDRGCEYRVQCLRVDGHEGDHLAEVTW